MLPPAPPPEPLPPPLFFLKAEKSFCQRVLSGGVIGGAEAVDGVFEGVSDKAREVSEEVEFENWREPLAKWCTWGISDVEFDEIWFPINPEKLDILSFFGYGELFLSLEWLQLHAWGYEI